MGAEKTNNAFAKAFKQHLKKQVIAGTVEAVNASKNTCTVAPADGGATYYGVRLRPAIGDGEYGILIIPKVGSQVLVGLIDNDERKPYVAMYSELDTVEMVAEGVYSVNGAAIHMNGDTYDSIKGAEIKAELDKTKTILDALIQVLGGAPIPEPGNGAASALQVALNGAVASLPAPDFSDITNNKVKHGSGN